MTAPPLPLLLGLTALAAVAAEPERGAMGVPAVRPPLPLAAVTIICPDSDGGRLESDRVAQALRQRGSQVTVLAAPQALDDSGLRLRPEVASATQVLLGDVNSNRALLGYYADLLDFTDAFHPGGDGYVLRSAPGGVGAGGDALILGAGTEEGLKRAADRFTEILGALAGPSLPYVFEVKLGGQAAASLATTEWSQPYDPQKWAGRGYGEMATYPSYVYALTAQTAGAEAAVAALLRAAQDPGWYPVGDYSLEWLVRGWSYVRDAPCVTEQQAATIDNALLRTLHEYRNEYWRGRDGSHIGGRHQTMGTSAFLTAVRLLLRRGNPDGRAKRQLETWRAECDAYFANAVTTFHDDLEGIPIYHSFQPIANEALRRGVAPYVAENLDLAVRRALAVTDNLGFYAGTGTYEEARPGTTRQGIMLGYPLAMGALVRQDAGYEWLLRRFRGVDIATWGLCSGYGAHRFARPATAPMEEPRHLLGLLTAPLGPYREARLPRGEGEPTPAPVRRFEKLCLRDSFDPTGQFLVLEGHQGAGADNVLPRDANSLIRYTDLGHIWLYANSERTGNFYRNAVQVSDGLSETCGEPACELLAARDAGPVALVASRLRGYVAADWTRNLIWRKGRYFAVIDLLDHTREGDHAATCTFRTPCAAEATATGMRAWEGDAELFVVNADSAARGVRRNLDREGAAIPTFLRERLPFAPERGTRLAFRNLVYATDPTRSMRLEARPAGRWAMLVHGTMPDGEEIALIGACPPGESLILGPLKTSASVFFASPQTVAAEGGEVLLAGKAVTGGAGLKSALMQLWTSARAASPPAPPRSVAAPATKLFTFSGFAPRGEMILGPDLRIDPPPSSGTVPDLTDGTIPLWQGVGFPGGADLRLTLDLRRTEKVDSIELAAGLLVGVNVRPDPDQLPPPKPATLQLDGGPERPVEFHCGFTYEPLHKGCVTAMARWRADLDGVATRRIGLLLSKEAWPGGAGIREIIVRRAGVSEVRPVFARSADVNGDGAPELLLAADGGEVCCLSAAGRELWRRTLPGPPTALECLDLGDGLPAILAATREARLYRLDAGGQIAWTVDFLPMAPENGDLPTAYSISSWRTRDGRREIVCGNYNACSFVSPDGSKMEYCRAGGAFETMLLPEALDLTGDGVEDQLAFNVWASLSLLDGAQRKTTAYHAAPAGEGLRFEWWDRSPAKPLLLVAADNGVGLMNALTGQYEWRRDVSPLTACVVGSFGATVGRAVAVTKRDGFLLVYSATGELLRRVMLPEELEAAAVVSAGDGFGRLVVATEGRIALFDSDLRQAATISDGGATGLLGLAETGTFAALRPRGSVDVLRCPTSVGR